MIKREGMTLIEIILALMLVGLIAATFIPAAVNSYSMMNTSKEITEETFGSQKDIEDKIDTFRKTKKSDLDPNAIDTKNIKFNEISDTISIDGSTIIGNDSNQTVSAFIPIVESLTDSTFPDVDVSIEADDCWINNDPNQNPIEVNVFLKSSPKLIGKINNKPSDFNSVVFRLIHNWYISDTEYTEGDAILFPYGFTKHSSITKENPAFNYEYELDLTSSLVAANKDKLIVYSITQITNYGSYGEKYSDPVLLKNENPVTEVQIEMQNSSGTAYNPQVSPFEVKITDKLEGFISNPENINMTGQTITHEWYKSISDTISTEFIDNEYEKISGESSNTLINLQNYNDKYIVYKLTFAGKTFYSQPILIEYTNTSEFPSTNGYIIEAAADLEKRVIDVSGSKPDANPPFILYSKHNGANQTWFFEKIADEDYYYIYWIRGNVKYYLYVDYDTEVGYKSGWFNQNWNRLGYLIEQSASLDRENTKYQWNIVSKGNSLYTIISRFEEDRNYNNRYMNFTNHFDPPRVIMTTSIYDWKIIEKQ